MGGSDVMEAIDGRYSDFTSSKTLPEQRRRSNLPDCLLNEPG